MIVPTRMRPPQISSNKRNTFVSEVNSDVDLLILIPEEMTTKELRSLRHRLEDTIEENHINRTVDLKLYTTARYIKLSQKPCFEKAIIKDLINIETW